MHFFSFLISPPAQLIINSCMQYTNFRKFSKNRTNHFPHCIITSQYFFCLCTIEDNLFSYKHKMCSADMNISFDFSYSIYFAMYFLRVLFLVNLTALLAFPIFFRQNSRLLCVRENTAPTSALTYLKCSLIHFVFCVCVKTLSGCMTHKWEFSWKTLCISCLYLERWTIGS